MKTNFRFQRLFSIASIILMAPLSGCIFLSTTQGEDKWSVGMVNDNSIVIRRRAMKNSEGKEEASSNAELRLNQGLLDVLTGANSQDDSADPGSR